MNIRPCLNTVEFLLKLIKRVEAHADATEMYPTERNLLKEEMSIARKQLLFLEGQLECELRVEEERVNSDDTTRN